MTGGLASFVRCFVSVTDGIPVHYCREHPIDVHADMIATCSEEEWADLMRAKYGHDFDAECFVDGPPNTTIKDSM